MTGLEILLWFYLAGGVVTGGAAGVFCEAWTRGDHSECAKVAAIAAVAWPVVVYVQVADD